MKSTSTQTRVAGFLFSIVMSFAVLGATAVGMNGNVLPSSEVVTLDRMVVSAAPGASAVN